MHQRFHHAELSRSQSKAREVRGQPRIQGARGAAQLDVSVKRADLARVTFEMRRHSFEPQSFEFKIISNSGSVNPAPLGSDYLRFRLPFRQLRSYSRYQWEARGR